MTTAPPPTWQQRRSRFNHDWLKNQFMPALAKAINLLDGQIEDPEFERVFALSFLPQWPAHRPELLALLADFEREMSPRRLLEHGRFDCRCSPRHHWLPDLVHALWLRRSPVSRWLADANQRVADIDRCYAQLRDCLDGGALQPGRQPLAAFRDACQALARAVEAFPAEVKVT